MKMQPLVLALSLSLTAISAQAAVDANIPKYAKTSGISGNLSSVGSDTLANLMTFWAEDFKKEYPNVNVQIQAAGSSTAPPALTQGTANFGPMSRSMKDNRSEERRVGKLWPNVSLHERQRNSRIREKIRLQANCGSCCC